MKVLVNKSLKEPVSVYNIYLQERREINSKLKNVSIFIYGKNNYSKKDGNRLGKRKHKLYVAMYFRTMQIKMDINSTYGSYGSNTVLTKPVMLVDEAAFIRENLTKRTRDISLSIARTDFKIGDKVINKSRNNTEYILSYTDLIRFKDEELVLVK